MIHKWFPDDFQPEKSPTIFQGLNLIANDALGWGPGVVLSDFTLGFGMVFEEAHNMHYSA